jgi:hypothetical protein
MFASHWCVKGVSAGASITSADFDLNNEHVTSAHHDWTLDFEMKAFTLQSSKPQTATL